MFLCIHDILNRLQRHMDIQHTQTHIHTNTLFFFASCQMGYQMPFHRPVTAVALLVSCDTLIRIKHTRVHIHTQATLALSHSRYVS